MQDVLSGTAIRALAAGRTVSNYAERRSAVAWFDQQDTQAQANIEALIEGAHLELAEKTAALDSKYDGWLNPDSVTMTDLRVVVLDRYGAVEAAFKHREDAAAYIKQAKREAEDGAVFTIARPARGQGDYFELIGLKE